MKELSVVLENCYGIKKLDFKFDFKKYKTYSIYAANGSMKTSFAKTFYDLSVGQDSKDLIFPDRVTIRDVKDESGNDIDLNKVFVVEPYNDEYSSDRTSTLLVNKVLKKTYDEIWLNIKNLEAELLKELKKPSGISRDIDKEVSEVVMSTSDKFLEAIQRLEKEVNDGKQPVFDKINYKVLFNDKVTKFLQDKDVQADLKNYIERYDELVDQSRYFRKGVFNHTNASAIAKTLVDNGFFDAAHTVSLSDEANAIKSEIASEDELKKLIEQEMQDILSDEKLLKAFQKIDNKLKNQELKDFREYVTEHKEYIPELSNVNYFKNRIWVDYLKTCLTTFNKLIDTYNTAKDELLSIQEQAKKERTRWAEVVEVFNSRFNVPFELSVENQGDVILNGVLPSLRFEFKDESGSRAVKQEELLRVLSNGEKKALYILNILFELEARKDQKIETLVIVDDIADSFDYKNKYAIIEYLKDMSEADDFYQIILTHNFDFFRTVQSRFVNYKSCLMVDKKAEGLSLISAEYIRNPFKNFIDNVSDDAKFLALIPFMRNLVEYTKGESDEDFVLLTSTLHQKENTEKITKKDVVDVIKRLFSKDVTVGNPDKVVADLFTEVADGCLKESENLKLENKIVLSVAIRLKAEKFMITAINDADFIKSLNSNQTAKMADRYINENPNKSKEIQVLKRVNLITPQNVHINSFMYEPILDMSDVELKKLCQEVSGLA